jgi:hypothetical protein
MTDLGPALKYLGWHITRDRKAGKMWLSLEQRIKKATVEFGVHKLSAMSTPLPTNWQAFLPHETDLNNPRRKPSPGSGDEFSEPLTEARHKYYRKGVGFINYVATSLRPDVAYAAGQLSQVLHCPRERHYKAMLHCLRYLGGTADLALHYDKNKSHQLLAYTDADYARCKGTRKSVSGGIFQYAGGPVHWFSKKQDSVTLSATESEYVAMTAGTRDVIWLRELLREYGVGEPGPTPLYIDNMGAKYLAAEPIVNAQTRHVSAMMHYVREQQGKCKTILVIHKPSEGQVADYLTKPLAREKLLTNIRMAGQVNRPAWDPNPVEEEDDWDWTESQERTTSEPNPDRGEEGHDGLLEPSGSLSTVKGECKATAVVSGFDCLYSRARKLAQNSLGHLRRLWDVSENTAWMEYLGP